MLRTKSNGVQATFTLILCLLTSTLFAQNIELAQDYYAHELNEKAKAELLSVYYSSESSPQKKAHALYLLGNIAFDETNLSTAISDWEKLINEFPDSKYATEIAGRLDQISDTVQQLSDNITLSATARAYMNNGDFWSNAENRFTVDSSYLLAPDLAVEWYDKIIDEYPDSAAAKRAYEKKIFALLGWREPRLGGVEYIFHKYMPLVIRTFQEYKRAYPESPALQGFRLEIAQAYWHEDDIEKARTWLNDILEESGTTETFYSQIAKARLNNLNR